MSILKKILKSKLFYGQVELYGTQWKLLFWFAIFCSEYEFSLRSLHFYLSIEA